MKGRRTIITLLGGVDGLLLASTVTHGQPACDPVEIWMKVGAILGGVVVGAYFAFRLHERKWALRVSILVTLTLLVLPQHMHHRPPCVRVPSGVACRFVSRPYAPSAEAAGLPTCIGLHDGRATLIDEVPTIVEIVDRQLVDGDVVHTFEQASRRRIMLVSADYHFAGYECVPAGDTLAEIMAACPQSAP